ncbi:MAG: heavy-metal-associated domain-containing protein [Anaerovoracaceae bacterium]|jgi:copper chaperone CopZ
MMKLTVSISGMSCGMCEAHINDIIRKNFKVKKVKSSHMKGRTEIICEEDISDQRLASAVGKAGYTVEAVKREPYRKKRLFH